MVAYAGTIPSTVSVKKSQLLKLWQTMMSRQECLSVTPMQIMLGKFRDYI